MASGSAEADRLLALELAAASGAVPTPVVLQPLLLAFVDPRVESRYLQHLAVRLQQVDKRLGMSYMTFHFIFLVVTLSEGVDLWVPNVILGAACASHYFVPAYVPPPLYAKWRQLYVLLLQAVYYMCVLTGMRAWWPVRVTSSASFVHSLVFASGVFTLLYASLGTLLPFRIHLLSQFFWTTLFSRAATPWLCNGVLCTLLGPRLVGCMFQYISPLSHVLLIPATDDTGPSNSGLTQCHASVAFMQLCVGLSLPTAAVYLQEYSSRRTFVSTNSATLPTRYLDWLESTAEAWWLRLLHLLVGGSVLCAVCWEVAVIGAHIRLGPESSKMDCPAA